MGFRGFPLYSLTERAPLLYHVPPHLRLLHKDGRVDAELQDEGGDGEADEQLEDRGVLGLGERGLPAVAVVEQHGIAAAKPHTRFKKPAFLFISHVLSLNIDVRFIGV